MQGQGARSGQIICSCWHNHGGNQQMISSKTKETKAIQTIKILNLEMVRGACQHVNDCHIHMVLKEQ